MATDHLTIRGQAKKQVSKMIKLKNKHTRDVTFKVTTDLPNFEGDKKFTIPASKEKNYQIKLTPNLCGYY